MFGAAGKVKRPSGMRLYLTCNQGKNCTSEGIFLDWCERNFGAPASHWELQRMGIRSTHADRVTD